MFFLNSKCIFLRFYFGENFYADDEVQVGLIETIKRMYHVQHDLKLNTQFGKFKWS
jgi:hypothetical protein